VGVVETNIQNLMNKEVSRKEFLGIAGLAVLSIFDFDTVVKLLSSKLVVGHQSIHYLSTSMYAGMDRGVNR
jgi:hypothetical protein